jgi:hypothetical protein
MKPGITALGLAAAVALALAAPHALAQTLYKLIDKNGKVTYSEKPPKDFDGKVIRMDIDPNANTATLPKLTPAPPDTSGSNEPARKSREPGSSKAKPVTVDEARERLDAARKAYQDAVDNPREGEITRMGNVGGGTRPVFSDAYTSRLAGLEAAVKNAEEDLRRAEGG